MKKLATVTIALITACVFLMFTACEPITEDLPTALGDLTPGPGSAYGGSSGTGGGIYVNSVPAFDINALPPVAYWNNTVGEIVNLPNPFVFADGSGVYTEADWSRRKEEILKILEFYLTGTHSPLPSEPVTVTGGNADGSGTYTVTVKANGRTATFTMTINLPTSTRDFGDGPVPVAPNGLPVSVTNPAPALFGNLSPFRPNGYATISSGATGSDGLAGVVQDLFQYDSASLDRPSSLIRAAWVTGRIIDAIEEGAGKGMIDPTKLLTTGVSRGGKLALYQGAFAKSMNGTQIAVTNPVSSGANGIALERVLGLPFKEYYWTKSLKTLGGTELIRLFPPDERTGLVRLDPERRGSIQSMPSIIGDGGGNWVSPRFKQFTNMYSEWKVNKDNARANYFGITGSMPFDAHFMSALVAPRGLYICDGWRSPWTNPDANYLGYLATREVYDFLDAYDNIGIRLYNVIHSNPAWEHWDFLDFANIYFNDHTDTHGAPYARLATTGDTLTYPVQTDVKYFIDEDPEYAGDLDAYGQANIATWYDPRNKDGKNRYDFLKLNWANPKKGLGASVADIVRDKTGWTND
ncbi:hypothetical protein AGMMS49991_08810 [Spirochaetia bacterium]|nr:hypothetical protein AGMMS49991_08810 [Spirochaetia bacterium]